MLAVLIFWGILLSIFLGLGDVFILSYNRFTNDNFKLSLPSTFFIGLAIGSIVACTLSLFLPLTVYPFLIILLGTTSYWIIRRKRLLAIVKNVLQQFQNFSVWNKLLFFFITFITLFHTSAFSSAFDQFLYHQQHIRWLQEYGVVNGLANLHLRFGFNSSSLSLTSLFAYRPELKISFTALNGLCLFVLSSWLIFKAQQNKNTAAALVYIITLVTFIDFYALELSSTSTDVLVNVLVIYLLLNLFFEKDIKSFYLPLAVLPAFCITLKLSSAPIIILSLFAYYCLFKEGMKRTLYCTLILSALIVVPWLTQNVILTGYLIFPFPDIDIFSFDWKVPTEIVAAEKITTYNWARGSQETSFGGWAPIWWAHQPPIFKSIYGLALASIVFFIVTFKRFLDKGNPGLMAACITAILGFIFGFLTAPALRFSYGFILPTIFISLLLLVNTKNRILNKILFGIQCFFTVLFALFYIEYVCFKTTQQIEFGGNYPRAQFIKPFPTSSATNEVPFDTVKVSNIDIFVPIPKANGRCFDQKLPCTPHVINNLELRGLDLSDGFRIKK